MTEKRAFLLASTVSDRALAVARLLAGLLYEISPWDAWTYLGGLVVLAVAAVLATLIPVIRATGIAPLIALQQE